MCVRVCVCVRTFTCSCVCVWGGCMCVCNRLACDLFAYFCCVFRCCQLAMICFFLGHKPLRWWIFPFYVAKRPVPLRSVCVHHTLWSPFHLITSHPWKIRALRYSGSHIHFIYIPECFSSPRFSEDKLAGFRGEAGKNVFSALKGLPHQYSQAASLQTSLLLQPSSKINPAFIPSLRPLASHFWRATDDWQHSQGSRSIWYPFWQNGATRKSMGTPPHLNGNYRHCAVVRDVVKHGKSPGNGNYIFYYN